MEHKNPAGTATSNPESTTTTPAAEAPLGRKKGGKSKRFETIEETTPITVSLPKGMVRQIRIVVAAGDQSLSDWLAEALLPILKRSLAKVVSDIGE